MELSIQKKKLSDFRSEESLRYDYKYISSFDVSSKDFYSYRQLFDFIPYQSIDMAGLERFKYAEIGNVSKLGEVEPVELSFDDRREENESLFKKIEKGDIISPNDGDILISKIRPYLNKNVLVGSDGIYFTKAFIHIRPKINSELFYLALRTKFISQINAISRQGKGYPTLKEDDLKSVRFPKRIVDALINYEGELLKKIKPIKEAINKLQDSKEKPLTIINQVFGEAFEFNWEEFETIKKEKSYTSSISKFANNIDCRMGIRFHNKAGAYIQSFLEKKTSKRIKDFIIEPIVLGKGVSPSDYDEEGEYYYIAMSNIKSWAFDPEDCKKVSESFALSNLNKTVKKGDILLARSGEGTIGKVALIEDEEINGIFADFTQRIRFTDFDPLCAYYYFRSDFFQYLVYTHKKGLGNNTNIFPSQIKEFPIPDWDEKKQVEIVESVKAQIDAQKVIDRQIEEKQQAINKVIEDAIMREQTDA
jgi:hypothetical protein